MNYFPIFLRVEGRACLVVGGGQIASRKVTALLRARAAVRVVAPEACAEVEALARDGVLRWEPRPYDARDLEGAHLVIAATRDRAVNARVSREAQSLRIPVNVVDDPELCTFIVPSIVDRSPVVVAISTGGASPALARMLRARLEAVLPAGAGPFAELLAHDRARVRDLIPGAAARTTFWKRALDGEVGSLGLSGRIDEARRALEDLLTGLRG